MLLVSLTIQYSSSVQRNLFKATSVPKCQQLPVVISTGPSSTAFFYFLAHVTHGASALGRFGQGRGHRTLPWSRFFIRPAVARFAPLETLWLQSPEAPGSET